MSRLFPFTTDAESAAEEPRLVDISEEAADDVFAALSSTTARAAYQSLHDEPRTASDLADVTDTSLQNVRYHLDNLRDAGLVEVVDTWYSERGTEMKVYAPADTSLVVFAGDDEDKSTLWTLVRNFVGGVAVLALASVAVQRVATRGLPFAANAGSGTTGQGSDVPTTVEYTRTAAATVTPTTTEAAGQGVPPGVVFFLGGFAVLLGLLAWQYAR